jgi:tRNA 2-selenouridine synthase
MERELDIAAFLEEAKTTPVIDVRTPSEFTQGHIPGAFNIPLFSDNERKEVGTIYKKSGRKQAIFKGLEITGPKMKDYVLQATDVAVNRRLLVHCWRGGMRSAGMAWLFNTTGLESAVLEGGYKTFRRHVLAVLEEDFPFIVIGGLTGSGKTEALHALEQSGEQVLDLEKLAHHKGSAFGSLGEKSQDTNEQFENNIFRCLNVLDRNKTIWIEDESRTIGKNTLPAGIFRQIRSAPLICLDVPLLDRVERLVQDYAGFRQNELSGSILRIRPRLGDQNARSAIRAIEEGHYHRAAKLVLHYYDKSYSYGLNRRDKNHVFSLPVKKAFNASERAEHILEFIRSNRISGQRFN